MDNSSTRTKEFILKEIQENGFLKDYSGFLNDREVAIAAMKKAPDNLKYFPKFQSDKEIIAKFIVPVTTVPLKYMAEELKNDLPFALEMLILDHSSLKYFSEEIGFSKEVIDIILKVPLFYTNQKYAPYLYQHHKESFLNTLKNDHLLYGKLPLELLNVKEIVLSRYQFQSNHISPYDYFKLKDNLQDDFEIILAFMNASRPQNMYFDKVVKNLSLHMKHDDKAPVFVKEYNKPLCKKIFTMLLDNNKAFNTELEESYKQNPNLNDYRELIREVRLLEKIKNNQPNDKSYKRAKL